MLLQKYQLTLYVHAAEIVAVNSTGCVIRTREGLKHVEFRDGVTARSGAAPGDYWIVYAKGQPSEFHSISPRGALLNGYVPCESAEEKIRRVALEARAVGAEEPY